MPWFEYRCGHAIHPQLRVEKSRIVFRYCQSSLSKCSAALIRCSSGLSNGWDRSSHRSIAGSLGCRSWSTGWNHSSKRWKAISHGSIDFPYGKKCWSHCWNDFPHCWKHFIHCLNHFRNGISRTSNHPEGICDGSPMDAFRASPARAVTPTGASCAGQPSFSATLSSPPPHANRP